MASVKVAVRVRPFNQREKDMNAKLIVQMDGKKTRLVTPKNKELSNDREKYKDFTFDHSYWSYDSNDEQYAAQDQVFSDLGVEVIDSAFEGYNACVFAYGQTGSGKTFTMMGTMDNQGLIPRICRDLFARVAAGKESGASYRTEVSYLEIYNERVADLLGGEASHNLKVREHPKLGPYVQDLSKHLVSDYDDIQECMHRGNLHRTTASTQMNDTSSRSHAIFTINFVQASYCKHNNMPSETVSKVHLVDLAGSERADATGATGQRLVEGAHINKSLVTLGSVISALADSSSKAKPSFIPYRDSVLTWLLKDSLGGNSKTIMIAAISPADCNYGETLSTLRYANRAKNIINTPTINEDPNVKLIRELRSEIEKLRAQIVVSVGDPVQAESQVLATLQRKEAQEKVLTEKWTEKWRETQQILQEQKALGLRKSGHGVVLDSDMPHLVGIDDNLLSTGVTLYHLKEGDTLIGSEDGDSVPDISLSGAGVMPDHCRITLQDGVATIFPKSNAQCWLNTVLIDKPTKLSQGCILLLGRTNMFRYNDPAEAAKLRREGSASVLNLSRLSLLSWSTTDLDTSDLESDSRPLDLEVQRAELKKEQEHFQRQQEERQKRWLQEKDLLEEAQRRLEEERRRMERAYRRAGSVGPQTSDGTIPSARPETVEGASGSRRLRVRQRELGARTKRLKALRAAHSDMVESESARIAVLESEISEKQNRLGEIIKDSIRQLLEKGVSIDRVPSVESNLLSDESSSCIMELLDECGGSEASDLKLTISRQRQELEEVESELSNRMASYASHTSKVHSLESELELAEAQQIGLEHTLRCSNQDDEDNFEHGAVQRSKSELVLTRKYLQEQSALSDTEKDYIRSKKMSLTLDLDPTKPSDMDDTFHTANSTLSPRNTFSIHSSPTSVDPMSNSAERVTTTADPMTTSGEQGPITSDDERHEGGGGLKVNFKLGLMHNDDSDEMSSTEDYAKSRKMNGQSSSSGQEYTNGDGLQHRGKYKRRFTGRKRQVTEAEALRAMQRLCQRIAQQKMLVISSLENDCSKEELNRQIAVLQELQKRYVRLEMALQYSFFDNNNSNRSRTLMVTPIQEMPSLTLSESDMQVTQEPLTQEEDQNGNNTFEYQPLDPLIQRLKEEVEASDNLSTSNEELLTTDGECGEGECWIDDPLRRFRDEVRGEAVTDTEQGSGIMQSSLNGNQTLSQLDFNRIVSVPSYVTRGAGTRTHHEYEIRIDLGPGQRWVLLRRYRRFRDLYLTMKNTYGTKVAVIPFPPRHLWSSESIARSRRPLLETFLRRLLNACSTDKRCPFYARPLTKETLIQFSPFFQKGVFETGKSGTG